MIFKDSVAYSSYVTEFTYGPNRCEEICLNFLYMLLCLLIYFIIELHFMLCTYG